MIHDELKRWFRAAVIALLISLGLNAGLVVYAQSLWYRMARYAGAADQAEHYIRVGCRND